MPLIGYGESHECQGFRMKQKWKKLLKRRLFRYLERLANHIHPTNGSGNNQSRM